jgi:hypothetical protein
MKAEPNFKDYWDWTSQRRKFNQVNITREEWCKLWIDSGFWPHRGRGKYDYIMSRIDKEKPFEIGNITFIQNKDRKFDRR